MATGRKASTAAVAETDGRTPSMRLSKDARIRNAIRSVPDGKVACYGGVALAAGMPGAARRVAMVLHNSVGLPWHRILGAGGEIKRTGEGAMEQRFLLESEGVTFRGRRVNMKLHEHQFATVRASLARPQEDASFDRVCSNADS